MITYGKLDTMRRSGRHLGVMSTGRAGLALAANGCGRPWLPAGAPVGFSAAPASLWHSMRECTT
jgi:hypothetical protein